MNSKWTLPDGWDWVPLGEICDIRGGGTPRRSNSSYFGGDVVWVTPSDLKPSELVQTVEESEITLTKAGVDSSSAKVLPVGTVLFSSRASIGKIAIAGTPLTTNQGFINFVCSDRVYNRYLAYSLRALIPQIIGLATSTTYLEVSRRSIRSFTVPLPFPDNPEWSLVEQRRIVARIEALLDEVREMRQLHGEITADAEAFMDACIQAVFGQQNSHWRAEQLSNIAYIQTGIAKGGRYGNAQLIELPYLRVANVQAGYLDLSEIKTLAIPRDRIERYRLEVGDLLLTEGGDYDKLGRGAIWEGQIEPCIHQNHVFAVRFDQKKVLPKFVEYEMQSRYAKDYFLRSAKRTTNLASINKTQLSNFPLRYPPSLEEQGQIVQYLDALQNEVTEIQKIQNADGQLISQLEQVILAQAFRGEL